MNTLEEIAEYRKEQSLKLIGKHQEIIDKTYEVIDMDILDSEIKKAEKKSDEKDSKSAKESVFLEKIRKRATALEQVEKSLLKIQELESLLIDSKTTPGSISTSEGRSPLQKHRKTG